jgi:glycosyltransferase involved in cell wall biosynthesis
LRVLLIANTLPPKDLSGVGEQVVQLAAGLREQGQDVQVLGRPRWSPKLLFPLTIVPAATAALVRQRPNVVQVHESDGALAALAVRALGIFLRPKPILVSLLQVSYLREIEAVRELRTLDRVLGEPGARERRFRWGKGRLQLFLGRLSARLSHLVLAPSERTARELREDYGVAKVKVLPNVTGGLPVEREPLGSGAREPGYLLFVGRLRVRKGVEVLLEALAQLAGEGQEARLLVAGDGEHRQALEIVVQKLGLDSRVEFLGRLSRGQVREALVGAAALVVPSLYEGMPLVILEAMEASVPVVASAVSGIPEVVQDGETGWLVPPESPGDLARALGQVLQKPEQARERGAAGRRRLDRLYRPEQGARLWLELVGQEGG